MAHYAILSDMKLTISQTAKKQVASNRARLNISEQEYVHNALTHYNQLLQLDTQLQEELGMWDAASTADFSHWSHKQRA